MEKILIVALSLRCSFAALFGILCKWCYLYLILLVLDAFRALSVDHFMGTIIERLQSESLLAAIAVDVSPLWWMGYVRSVWSAFIDALWKLVFSCGKKDGESYAPWVFAIVDCIAFLLYFVVATTLTTFTS
jgi:hypothetical protein